MKVADLAGRQLDYWVDKGEGLPDLGFDFFEAGGGLGARRANDRPGADRF